MEPIHLGTAPLDDDTFVEAFESCRLPTAQFHHADHIRLAWVYLGRMTEAEAARRIEQAIRRFAEYNGVGEKYHHTITVAWMRLVAAARRATPEATHFGMFARVQAHLLDVNVLQKHYSKERLLSPEARREWVEPDLVPLA